MTRILAFSGSTRDGSLNRMTVDCLAAIATSKGASVSRADLGELAMPIYDGDLEARDGLPAGAAKLRDMLLEAEGVIIGCPEYNGFMTPLLLNAIDWCSRTDGARPDLSPFRDKVVLIASASPGGFGGMRAAGHLRTMLAGIGCLVIPQGVSVPAAMSAFADDGGFADENLTKRAGGAIDKLIDMTARMR